MKSTYTPLQMNKHHVQLHTSCTVYKYIYIICKHMYIMDIYIQTITNTYTLCTNTIKEQKIFLYIYINIYKLSLQHDLSGISDLKREIKEKTESKTKECAKFKFQLKSSIK